MSAVENEKIEVGDKVRINISGHDYHRKMGVIVAAKTLTRFRVYFPYIFKGKRNHFETFDVKDLEYVQ